MISIRKSSERGAVRLDWLDGKHTFSFGDYYDPDHMGFGKIRVINDDRIAPGKGFATHPHNDMEIISYVVDGKLQHRDNIGNGSVLNSSDVQRMTAGTGIKHSEVNPSSDRPVRLLQIWIEPDRISLVPEYEQKNFSQDDKLDRLRLIVSPDGRDGSLYMHQDVLLYASILTAGSGVSHRFATARRGWLQMVSGDLSMNGEVLEGGDGAAVSNTREIELHTDKGAEFLLFDLT